MKKIIVTLLSVLSLISLNTLQAQTTVVTFNLANYNDHPDWSKRIKLIVDAIESVKADIVVLQEVRLDPDQNETKLTYQNSAEQVLRELNTRGDFLNADIVSQPAMYYPQANENGTHPYPLPGKFTSSGHSYIWEGLSIISKRKILEMGTLILSQSAYCNDFNKRITLFAKIAGNKSEVPLWLANIHFGLSNQCIADNIKETADYIQRLDKTLPLLMLGDFNTPPSNPDLSLFRKMGLSDLWPQLNQASPGYTFPSNYPSQRIDYMWANDAMLQQVSASSSMVIIGQNKEGELYPSDHLGLALSY